MNLPLFDDTEPGVSWSEQLVPGALVLRHFANTRDAGLLAALQQITAAAPLRRMTTPGGLAMSVAMSSCGSYGWVSDRHGYRYAGHDPDSGLPWPPMPELFLNLAQEAAQAAGFPGFTPDSCLINRYTPGARLSLHQDKDESDFTAPIVSVSLGIPATFLFGGVRRSDKAVRILLTHGDVVVWGGPARLNYHGVAPIKDNRHPLLGAVRINLTFRKAG